MFHPSQVVLFLVMTLFIVYIFWLRTLFIERLIYLAFALVGILLVIEPDLSTKIAHLIGIGRGTDLLFYIFILAFLFHAVNVRSQLIRLQKQATFLARQIALKQPLYGPLPPVEPSKTVLPPVEKDQNASKITLEDRP